MKTQSIKQKVIENIYNKPKLKEKYRLVTDRAQLQLDYIYEYGITDFWILDEILDDQFRVTK